MLEKVSFTKSIFKELAVRCSIAFIDFTKWKAADVILTKSLILDFWNCSDSNKYYLIFTWIPWFFRHFTTRQAGRRVGRREGCRWITKKSISGLFHKGLSTIDNSWRDCTCKSLSAVQVLMPLCHIFCLLPQKRKKRKKRKKTNNAVQKILRKFK